MKKLLKDFKESLVGKKIRIVRQCRFFGKKYGGYQKYLVPSYVYEVVNFFSEYDCGPALKLRCLSRRKWWNHFVFVHSGEIEFKIVKGRPEDFLRRGRLPKMEGWGFFEFDELVAKYSCPDAIKEIRKELQKMRVPQAA